jgi:hypothetical protein
MPYAAFDPGAHRVTRPTAGDLAALARDAAPPHLVILDYRLDGFEPLQAFRGLEVLKIQGASKVRDLAPLASLTSLRALVISTAPGSDGSGRTIDVASLAPLTALTALDTLILMNVQPLDGDVAVLGRLTHLRELDVSGPAFTLDVYAGLAVALPGVRGRCLSPYFIIENLAFCRTCKRQQVLLVGAPPRARKFLCPTCQAKALAAHVARWDAAKAAATRT